MSETDGTTAPAGVDAPDADAAEEYAERVGVDPTHEEVDHYLEMVGEQPLADPGTSPT
jgi:hypothetical protein